MSDNKRQSDMNRRQLKMYQTDFRLIFEQKAKTNREQLECASNAIYASGRYKPRPIVYFSNPYVMAACMWELDGAKSTKDQKEVIKRFGSAYGDETISLEEIRKSKPTKNTKKIIDFFIDNAVFPYSTESHENLVTFHEMQTMEPDCCLRIVGMAACDMYSVPRRLTSSTAS